MNKEHTIVHYYGRLAAIILPLVGAIIAFAFATTLAEPASVSKVISNVVGYLVVVLLLLIPANSIIRRVEYTGTTINQTKGWLYKIRSSINLTRVVKIEPMVTHHFRTGRAAWLRLTDDSGKIFIMDIATYGAQITEALADPMRQQLANPKVEIIHTSKLSTVRDVLKDVYENLPQDLNDQVMQQDRSVLAASQHWQVRDSLNHVTRTVVLIILGTAAGFGVLIGLMYMLYKFVPGF